MVFWVFVRPVHARLAMLMVVFRIISPCGFAASEVLYFGALPALRGAQTVALLTQGSQSMRPAISTGQLSLEAA